MFVFLYAEEDDPASVVAFRDHGLSIRERG